MSHSAYTGPDMTTKEGRAGLTWRLAQRRRLFLPVYRLPQVNDQKNQKENG